MNSLSPESMLVEIARPSAGLLVSALPDLNP